ncbi:hypothetical protein QZJ98_13645 [Acinetobacter baumannii]|nr:hypothetical protein [Acinetobacter baumannii]MDN8339270.1 hypothetical protein [Acinetobacter baumannii]
MTAIIDGVKKTWEFDLCIECKASETAPLTKNQTKAFPEISKSGATIVGKGKDGFSGGTKIPPTEVIISRPDILPKNKDLV